VTVEGHIDADLDKTHVEQRIVEPDLVDTFVGKRDVRAAPGPLTPSAKGGSVFAYQVLQPVIDVAPGGKSAKVRARLLNLRGNSEATGYWTAGTLEGQVVAEQGAWKFQAPRSSTVWSAPYPGGWARIP